MKGKSDRIADSCFGCQMTNHIGIHPVQSVAQLLIINYVAPDKVEITIVYLGSYVCKFHLRQIKGIPSSGYR